MAIDTSNTTSSASSAAATAAANSAIDSFTGAGSSAQDIENRFLTLLVSQMKNQDPLNPLDNSQVTSQMAQLSTVSGINQMNSSLTSVLASLSALQPIQAAGLVGHSVAVQGNGLALSGGTGSAGFSLDQPADAVTVTITDANGATVRTLNLGAGSAGSNTFAWDGKNDAGAALTDGSYKFSVTATASGQPVTATALTIGKVQGIVPGANGFSVNLGAQGIVPFANVSQIL